MAVFGYFCYSESETGSSGKAPKALEGVQSRSIRSYCRKHDRQLDGIFHDLGGKWSAAFDRREQSRRLLAEQKVARRIARLKEEGWSLRAIARKVTTPATPISFKTVQRVLQRQAEP